MKSVAFVLFLLIPTLALAIVDSDGRPVTSLNGGRDRSSIHSTNDPLPAPGLTLGEIAQLKETGTLVLRESDLNRPHLIRGVRYEMVSAQQIINSKIASATAYGLRVAARDPSQTCDGTKMCVVLVVVGRAKKK